jgi:serine/threonine protein kinase
VILPRLDWVARTRIATEVCRGLVYLHLRCVRPRPHHPHAFPHPASLSRPQTSLEQRLGVLCLPTRPDESPLRVISALARRKPEPVVHRDVKPDNVLLDSHLSAKLADVGVAKFMPRAIDTQNR